ncbi:MAG: uracil-DNA glycosylase family protein [Candidatus Limnocylindrales bacterium]
MTDLPSDIEILLERPGPGPHRATIVVDGAPVKTLADLPPLRDRLLFVGLNPSPVSVATGHYFQGRLGHVFWERLMTAQILPADTSIPTADDILVAAGHGLTDLLKLPTPRDEASAATLRSGVGPLWQKVAIWRPAAVVFVYKRAAEIVAARSLLEPWGQLGGVALSGRPCFLMPGPYAPAKEVSAGLNYLRNLGASLPR